MYPEHPKHEMAVLHTRRRRSTSYKHPTDTGPKRDERVGNEENHKTEFRA
jgi:hypothetical protein